MVKCFKDGGQSVVDTGYCSILSYGRHVTCYVKVLLWIIPVNFITPSQSSQTHIETPTSLRILRSNNTLVRTGDIDPKEAYLKLEKAYNQKYAEAEYNGVELGLLKESMELQKEARGSKKKVRHPHGHLYDPEWRDDHPEEVAERLEREREATRTRKRKADDKRMVETFTSAGLEALRRARTSPSS